MQETWVMWVRFLGQEDLLGKGMATHSSILAWRIPWTEEPGGLQSMGSQRVRHNWATKHLTWLDNTTYPTSQGTFPALGRLVCCVSRAKSLQSCPTLCDPMDCSPPGSSVQGILEARILEWGAMPSSRGSSWPRDWIHISYVSSIGRQILYHYCHLGSPY